MSIDVLRLVDGSPILTGEGWVPLSAASDMSGISQKQLLRLAASGGLGLWCRVQRLTGYLVPVCDLEFDTPSLGAIGGLVLPSPADMPESAIECILGGVLEIPMTDSIGIASAALAEDLEEVEIVAFQAPKQPNKVFIPNEGVRFLVTSFELSTVEVENIRQRWAEKVTPEEIGRLQELQKTAAHKEATSAGKKANQRYSDALDAFTREVLNDKITQPKEIERQRRGIALFIEFMGDMKLGEIDGDVLRTFRDVHLATVPSRLNHAETRFKTKGVKPTIAAINASGKSWPILSAEERDLRITWICRMFRWLQPDWLNSDPSISLRGVSVLTKSERKIEDQTKQRRTPFTQAELTSIFSQQWFVSGKVTDALGPNRKCRPFEYWLPLMALHAGERIGELCQLQLADVKQTKAGIWFLHIHEILKGMSLKNTSSTRMVPLHPILIQAGFVEWCDRLRQEGYQRVFPELSWEPVTRYAKEPKRAMSEMLEKLGMPRDGTKVFHSFRHNANNALIRLSDSSQVPDRIRLRVLGHKAGDGVNIEHYFNDYEADETTGFVAKLDFDLPPIAHFNMDEGIKSVQDALARKKGSRRNQEDMGPLNA